MSSGNVEVLSDLVELSFERTHSGHFEVLHVLIYVFYIIVQCDMALNRIVWNSGIKRVLFFYSRQENPSRTFYTSMNCNSALCLDQVGSYAT